MLRYIFAMGRKITSSTERAGRGRRRGSVKTKMEDVAGDVNISRVRHNLSNWEDDTTPLAPLTPRERDSIIELTSASGWRPLIPSEGIKNGERKMEELPDGGGGGGDVVAGRDDPNVLLQHSLGRLKLGELRIESSQQVSVFI